MHHVKLHSEYSFGHFYGKIEDVLLASESKEYAGICDRNGTWGHIAWDKLCKSKGIKPIFGVELAVVEDMEQRTKQAVNWMSFIALNNDGLKEIYNLVSLATEKFYYHPRIDYETVNSISNNIAILSGNNLYYLNANSSIVKKDNFYLEVSEFLMPFYFRTFFDCKKIIVSNNFYPFSNDKYAYEIVVSRNSRNAENYSFNMHICSPNLQVLRGTFSEDEFIIAISDALDNNRLICETSNVTLPKASMVKPQTEYTLEQLCINGLVKKDISLLDIKYKDRLDHELKIIREKKFDDYFILVNDIVSYARSRMLVGPARGSACGSLVCYILDITTIDPLKYDLLFERFIDTNRDDLPDIDIDFPDNRRDEVIQYIQNKYGNDRVAKLGTISYFKPKSALLDCCRALKIPSYELNSIKDSILEKYTEPFISCLDATFKATDEGKKFINKHLEMQIAAKIENHARHTGVHSAGIVVADEPINKFCSIDNKSGAIQLDKKEAEEIGLLKIDLLGLRTLSVIEDALTQINISKDVLFNIDLNDSQCYELLNKSKFAGIFQFEGLTLQGLCNRVKITCFDDITAITALGRPGPLMSGGTNKYIDCKNGVSSPNYLHNTIKEITEKTYGVIVYQEQVMKLCKNLGNMSWKDISILRRIISKANNLDIDHYFSVFVNGATQNGLSMPQAVETWEQIKTMGSYAFNKSHAVAYAMISYWCLYLKAHYPLFFACACLKNAKDDDQVISILRELNKEGVHYKLVDRELSELNWMVKDEMLIGGFLNIKGVGKQTAQIIIDKRNSNVPFTPRQELILSECKTPFDNLFDVQNKWGHILHDPIKYNILSKMCFIEDIKTESNITVVFIAKIHSIEVKNINSDWNIKQRDGLKLSGPEYYVTCKAEDDTGVITCVLNRYTHDKQNKDFTKNHKEGDYYIIKGESSAGFRTVNIKIYKKITDESYYKMR